MVRRFTFLILFAVVAFPACEDKKSPPDNTISDEDLEIISSPDITADDVLEPKEEEEEVPKNLKMIDTVSGQLLVQEELIPFLTQYGKENPEDKVRISTDMGDIDIRLFRDTPLHRANFILLVKQGYFEETYFHRVAKGFVVQGGNSDNASTNQKRYKIGSFLIPNEYTNRHPHVRGAFSAAKYSEQNVSNASSPFEFFIVQSKNGAHHLDGEHTVYGTVIKGMDIVDKIAEQETDEGEWPLRNIKLNVKILD